MVVVDEKYTAPPPPYEAIESVPPPPFSNEPLQPSPPSLATLPSHLVLKIVYMTFPPETSRTNEDRLERQHRTLHWLAQELRRVNKSFYTTCMHVLRSTYLPAYTSLVRIPYTSDPLPPSPRMSSPTGPEPTHRETRVLDLFIALQVREDVLMDETELHLERDESFRDLFDLMQPRSRLEDLVRDRGLHEGVVHVGARELGSETRSGSLPFSMLSVSFSPRRVGLVLTTPTGKRTIVEVARTRDEGLEATARELIQQLRIWQSDAGASENR